MRYVPGVSSTLGTEGREGIVTKIINISISLPCCFCFVIYCFIYFLVSAAALRSTTVGSEQMSTGHLVILASLRSVQSGHPLDVLHLCNPAGGYISWGSGSDGSTGNNKSKLNDIVCRGGSCVIDPYGHAVSETVWDKEEIIYADLDMQKVPASRMEHDVCGHYARPDVLKLSVEDK